MRRPAPVEVVIARNGTLGPLHLAIPIAPGRWAAACRTARGERRELAGDRVAVWTQETGGAVWGEVRTCADCLDLGDRVESTTELALAAGWTTPRSGDPRVPGRTVSPLRR